MESQVKRAMEHFVADDLIIRVPVTFEPGSAVTTLTGATVVAVVRLDGAAPVTGTVAIDPGGEALVASWSEGALTIGTGEVQIRATKDGFTRTLLSDRIAVLESL